MPSAAFFLFKINIINVTLKMCNKPCPEFFFLYMYIIGIAY